jgi:hypothetical protein
MTRPGEQALIVLRRTRLPILELAIGAAARRFGRICVLSSTRGLGPITMSSNTGMADFSRCFVDLSR